MKDDRAGSSGGSADSGGAPSSGASGSGASSSGASPADSSEHLPPEDNATSSEGADRPAEPDSADHPAEVDLVERSADDDPTAEPGEGWAGVEENRLSGDPTSERDEGWAGLEENPLSDGPNAVADDSGGYGAERELTGKERMVAEYREALAEAEIQDEPAASGPVYEASEFGDDAVWDPAAAVDRDDADLIPGSKADEEDLILDAASVAYPKTPRHPVPVEEHSVDSLSSERGDTGRGSSTIKKVGYGTATAIALLVVGGLIVNNGGGDETTTSVVPTSPAITVAAEVSQPVVSVTQPEVTQPTPATPPPTTADPLAPFVGVWRMIHEDGQEIELVIQKAEDGSLELMRTAQHSAQCEEFGTPVASVLTGYAGVTDSVIRLDYEFSTCRTAWGDVHSEFSGGQGLRLEGGMLTSDGSTCYRQGPAEPCDGVVPAALPVIAPDIEALVDKYGRDWVQDNYQGDLTEIGLHPAQLQPFSMQVCWPQADAPPPDLSGYRVHRAQVGNRPRDLVAGPNETTWVHQRGTDGVTVFDYRQDGLGEIPGVGFPRSDGSLVVFHTFGKVSYTTSHDVAPISILTIEDDEGNLPTDGRGNIEDWITDAYPVGNEVLVSRRSGYYRYDLSGNELWKWEHGGHLGSLVPGDGVFWGADREGNLFRIPLDGSPEDALYVDAAIRKDAPERLRPIPTLVPVPGGVWVTNGDNTIVFVDDDGTAGDPVVVGPRPRGDGIHNVPARNVLCGAGFLWIENGDGSAVRVPLDDPTTVEAIAAMPVLLSPGVQWHVEASRLRARDNATGLDLGEWDLPENEQGMMFTWAHDSVWISYQEGITFQLRE